MQKTSEQMDPVAAHQSLGSSEPLTASSSPSDDVMIVDKESLSPSDLPPPVRSTHQILQLKAGELLIARYGHKFLHQLVTRHRPLMYLHSAEQFRPCSTHFYLQHAKLYLEDQLIELKEGEELTSERLGNHQWLESLCDRYPLIPRTSDSRQSHRRHRKFNLRLNPEFRSGFAVAQINEAPVYSYVRDRDQFFEILYIFHYAYNGPYKILGLWEAGAHDADFEHCCVRVLKSSPSIDSIYFGAHGWLDGQWAFPPSSKRSPHFQTVDGDENRPIVFIAKNGHATYPSTGRWWRIWGCANDLTEKGLKWDPKHVVLLHNPPTPTDQNKEITTASSSLSSSSSPSSVSPSSCSASCCTLLTDLSWLLYSGWWEYDGIDSVHQQRWWEADPETSNSTSRRLFFSFMPEILGMKPEKWALKQLRKEETQR